MSRIKCNCGFTLSNSSNPDIEYKVFSNAEWSILLDRAEKEPVINIDVDKVSLWKCENCKRLYVFHEDDDRPQVYKIEIDNNIKW